MNLGSYRDIWHYMLGKVQGYREHSAEVARAGTTIARPDTFALGREDAFNQVLAVMESLEETLKQEERNRINRNKLEGKGG